MGTERGSEVLYMPSYRSQPTRTYCCHDILVLKGTEGGRRRFMHTPMAVWAHKLLLPQRDLCSSGHSPCAGCVGGHICFIVGTFN